MGMEMGRSVRASCCQIIFGPKFWGRTDTASRARDTLDTISPSSPARLRALRVPSAPLPSSNIKRPPAIHSSHWPSLSPPVSIRSNPHALPKPSAALGSPLHPHPQRPSHRTQRLIRRLQRLTLHYRDKGWLESRRQDTAFSHSRRPIRNIQIRFNSAEFRLNAKLWLHPARLPQTEQMRRIHHPMNWGTLNVDPLPAESNLSK
jgi:hypothetical protein